MPRATQLVDRRNCMLSVQRPGKPTIEGYATNYDTNVGELTQVPSYVIERMVGTSGFEPLTSTVSR
jgi:hypothetical protein